MAGRPQYESHDEYIAASASAAQPVLKKIQSLVEAKVANTTRVISYGMPAFRRGKVFCYFAAFKQHIGIYPPLKEPAELVAQLAPWRGPKGNLSFPLTETMPYALIGKVVVALADQYAPVSNMVKKPASKKPVRAANKAVKPRSQTSKAKARM